MTRTQAETGTCPQCFRPIARDANGWTCWICCSAWEQLPAVQQPATRQLPDKHLGGVHNPARTYRPPADAAQTCPNEPPCAHGRFLHDIPEQAVRREVCSVDGCRCGATT